MIARKHLKIIIFASCIFFVLPGVMLCAEDTFVIKAKKIYTATNGVIKDGMILVKDGKILNARKDLLVPKGAKEIKAITLNAAEAVNLDQRIGSIEEGKDADLVLLDGEPFEFMTSVEKVVIDGKIEYKREAKEKLHFQFSLPQAQRKLTIPSNVQDSQKMAIKGGTIYSMAGEPIEKGIILVKGGKIEKIGKYLSIPEDYPVLDAQEFVIMPGLVSARSYIGISLNWRRQSSIDEKSKPVVPELEVKHAIEPQAPHFTFCREMGITTAIVTPGNMNVISGQGVVLKTNGAVVDIMIIKDKAVMVFGLGASAKREDKMPSTRMGIAALLRETLTKAQEYRKKVEAYEKEKKGEELKRDLAMEALLPVLRKEMPVMIHCERKDDILTALRIADEFKLGIIFDGATDAYKLVDEIKKRNIPVVLENLFILNHGAEAYKVADKLASRKIPVLVGPVASYHQKMETKEAVYENALLLQKAGVKIAFQTGSVQNFSDLLYQAELAVSYGLPYDEALKALTLYPAQIFGVEDKLGSLEKGKIADIVIFEGFPLRSLARVKMIIIKGHTNEDFF